MPTNKPRLTVTFPSEIMDYIEDYKERYHMKSEAQAVITLIRSGMEETEKEKTPITDMSAIGVSKESTVSQLSRLLSRLGIVKDGDISDRDYHFLVAVFDMLKAHFNE